MALPSNCCLILGFILTTVRCLLECSGQSLNTSFVFGESLVDAGNNNYIVSLSKADYLPNGIDFFPSQKPTGRYTNGRTIADFLGNHNPSSQLYNSVKHLGCRQYTPPYLAPSTVGDVVLNGVNYASGGGGILNATGKLFGGRINLDAQIDNYANSRQDIISSMGMPSAVRLLKRALFSVTIGSNDFINNYLTPIFSVPERATIPPESFIEAMISKYRLQLTRLYYLDARKIIVVNVGPIGCIPYLREINPSAGTNCVAFPNQLAQLFNERLKDLVMEMSSNLKESRFVYADVYSIFSDIIQNYSSYGFEVVDSACCFVSGSFGGLVPCGPTSKVYPNRSKYVFWDPYHPSDAANVIIAKRLVDGDANDIFPLNVRQLVQALDDF